MILGFGNNVVSSLASDITASQTTFSVLPGDGPLFAPLLTSDFSNKSTTLKNYAKITLTDSGETAFEVCHLTAVSGDTLTVIRGQEGTTAKGWALKDVVGNFSTRGSENSFPQIAHIQSGFYTSGTAGGTANALTLELPTTFFLNGSTDWVMKTPIVVYPTQNNTGAATLQLTMGGRVLGTFKLYKGNKAELVANDILKDVALVCLLDNTKTFFNVANPGAIYAGLGTAAFRDVTSSRYDATSGRVLQVGDYGLGTTVGLAMLSSIFDITCTAKHAALGVGAGSSATEGMPANSGNTRFSVDVDSIYTNQYWVTLRSSNQSYVGMINTSAKTATWSQLYSTAFKPTAGDVGALPITGGTLTGLLTISNATPYIALRATGSDTRRYIMGFNSDGSSSFYVGKANANSESCMLWNYTPGSGIEITADGRINVNSKGRTSVFNTDGTFAPAAWTNFDARYQAKGNYTPAGQAYTKAESDARYVQNIRLGAVESSNTWAEKSPYVVTGSDKVVGDDYVGHAVRRPLQKLVNGTWINAGW
ncbi:phage tail protein [Enterobacter sp. Lyrl_3]|uniref:phage tail protein n=1 Tax=Enterobacter sp. Lyrl_3 TaxID=3110922 RepID=UPI003F7E002B